MTQDPSNQPCYEVFQEIDIESQDEANFSFSSYNKGSDDFSLNEEEPQPHRTSACSDSAPDGLPE